MQSLSDYFHTRALSYMDLAPGLSVPADFGDWQGEYWAIRRHSGLFDFSFMHTIEVSGQEVIAVLEQFQCRSVRDQSVGSIRYSFVMDGQGRTNLDITIWRLGQDQFWLIAGRPIYDLFSNFADQFPNTLVITERTPQYSIFAVQGPKSDLSIMNTIGCPREDLPQFFTFIDIQFANSTIRIARLGYTGELGYELFVPTEMAKHLWIKLLDTNPDLRECGFMAANALRIEAGFLLFANELQEGRTLAELNYERFLQKQEAPPEKLVGLTFMDIQAHLDPEYSADLDHFVTVTSRCYSPGLQCEIGLGFCDTEQAHSKKKALTRELEPVEIMKLPFYRNDKP